MTTTLDIPSSFPTGRTDPHAPATIDPADYTFVEGYYVGVPEEVAMMLAVTGDDAVEKWRAEQGRVRDLLDREGWKGGNFARCHTCDHCGAAFKYGSIYRHEPTRELIVVGWICAEKTMDVTDRATLEHQRLVDRVHGMRAAVQARQARDRRSKELREVHPDVADALETCQHPIVEDIRARFAQYGQLSEKQMALVLKLANDAKNPRAEPNWLDVEEGRRKVEGTVLAAKVNDFGAWKMLLQIDRDGGAEKVWTTIPAAIVDSSASAANGDLRGLLRGKRVRMTVTIKRSDRDAKFGIGKRPTGGEVVA